MTLKTLSLQQSLPTTLNKLIIRTKQSWASLSKKMRRAITWVDRTSSITGSKLTQPHHTSFHSLLTNRLACNREVNRQSLE